MTVHAPAAEWPEERRARFTDYRRTGSRDLRDRLIRRHVPFAHRVARRFGRRGIPREDLEQVAAVGLVRAVDRFDPWRGVPFEAFAAPTIVGEIKHTFRDLTWDVRVPRRLRELHLTLNLAVERFSVREGRTPSVPELARLVGVAEEDVVAAMEAGIAYRADPLVAPDDDRTALVTATLGVDDPLLTSAADRLLVAGLLSRLPRRQQLVVRMRYWDHLTQDAIAAELGISQMHVSRLLRRSLAELHELLEGDG